MNAKDIRKTIIELVQKENDLGRLETILRLMEISQRDLPVDAGLIESVLMSEKEYEEGRGLSLETARKIIKRGDK